MTDCKAPCITLSPLSTDRSIQTSSSRLPITVPLVDLFFASLPQYLPRKPHQERKAKQEEGGTKMMMLSEKLTQRTSHRWLLFALAVGLAVAMALYVRSP